MTAGTLAFVGAEMPALFASHLTGSCLKPLALLFNIQPQRREEGSLGSHQGQESPWNLSSGNTASGIACLTGGPQPAAPLSLTSSMSGLESQGVWDLGDTHFNTSRPFLGPGRGLLFQICEAWIGSVPE